MADKDFQIFILTCLIAIVSTAGNLLIFNGATDVTKSVLETESDVFLPVLTDGIVPEAVRGKSVGGPKSLKVSLFFTKHNPYQGSTFEWESPSSEASQMGLKGFYAEIDGKRSGYLYHKLYILNNTGFESQPLTFRMKVENFSRTVDDFTVKVYSMPAEESFRNNSEVFQYMFLRTNISSDNTFFDPDEWSPTIAYKPLWDTKSVDIYISLPPKQDNRLSMQFHVKLLPCSDGDKTVTEKSINKDGNTTDTEVFLNFSQLEDDISYSIVVEFNKDGNNSMCDNSCRFIQTKEFTLSRNGPLSEHHLSSKCRYMPIYPTKPQHSSTTELTMTPVKTEDTTSESDTVVIVVVTLTFFVAVSLVCLVVFLHRHSKKKQDNDQPTEEPYLLPETDIAAIPQENVKDLQRKTVYIVSASDHEETDDLIKSFCAFLKAHCHCDVISSSDVNQHQISDSVWVTTKMSNSDCIIFVNSRGAGKLLDVYLDNKECDSDLPQSPAFKSFQFSFNSEDLKSKFITVSFHEDWFKDKLAILNPKKYFLPRQFPHLLRGIHNLSERDAEKYEDRLPLNKNCLDNLPEWQPFFEAMRQVENFEKNIKSLTEAKDDHIISPPSTGPLNGQLSVSMTNLNVNTDIPEHPSTNSPFGQLDGLSCYTFDKASDLIPHSTNKNSTQLAFTDTQITGDLQSSQGATINSNTNHDNFNEAGHAAHDANHIPEIKKPAAPHHIKPPRGNPNLPSGDDVSNVLARWNDNVSIFSKQPDEGTTGQKENGEELEKLSNSVNQSWVIKPPPDLLPTDNISAQLKAFNDEESSKFYIKRLQEKQDGTDEIAV